MKPEIYSEMALIQGHHWWFCGRRKILEEIIHSLELPVTSEIVEIGCGTGGNLAMLSAFGHVCGVECDDYARETAVQLTGVPVLSGKLPDAIPYDDATFDLVCLLDVLEHIEDDVNALVTAGRLLKPSGRLLVTVPAYNWLWSSHDDAHLHKRRYTKALLQSKAMAANLSIVRVGYFCMLMFPIIAAVRSIMNLLGKTGGSDATLPCRWLNAILSEVFAFESHFLRGRFFPFGSSVVAVLSPVHV